MKASIYLLDTNILSDVIKNPKGRAASQLVQEEPQQLCTSIIVAAEMRYGVEKKNMPELTRRVNRILSAIHVLPLDQNADRHYGQIRAQLEKEGMIIGANDLFIAAHARARDAILVTDNLKEFSHVQGLKLENWL
ncbi:PilT domain-containing protein [Candidatus Glomeribacter gigasporarum BEG34]|uniref:Ribonuclease VapC n=1 Tax=Candidatus Glomeribacter gigasporarum BEG34 TaxID=1070319 RepID=G2JB99_9BURK|nr:type II toxin-antitoxin system VapC family toxin [Candidatus Glomeribacter gigasporarum]CCD30052.1 PilT domain-containing protein [Candidatus Glomeribacter gigasporarum BEG34]